jgi:hypothetical protein
MMKKYRIELSEDQLRLVSNCLEDVSRFAGGQCNLSYTVEEMLRGLPFEEQMRRRDETEAHLEQIKRILLPELQDNASRGYNGTDFIGNVYQIYRTILHKLTVDKGITNVYSSPALPSGNMGRVIIKQIKE